MRIIVFGLIIILVLLLTFEVGITVLSERGLAKAMRSQYGLPDTLKASINSFPLTTSMLRNHLGLLRLSWQGEIDAVTPSGKESKPPYNGQVSLYDVELNMSSLLRSRLEIRRISRIKAAIFLDPSSLNVALGYQYEQLKVEDGQIFESIWGQKVQYKVEILHGDTIWLKPLGLSINDSDSTQNPQSSMQPGLNMVILANLPLGARIQSASVRGNRVVFEIVTPMWEGYMEI